MNEETLFHLALEKSSPEERAAFLDGVCFGQPQLRAAVEALLQAHEGISSFLNRPPISESTTCDVAPGRASDSAVWPRCGDMDGRLGPYKLIKKIGEGGMGEVWLAEQSQPFKRNVALKIIKPGMGSEQILARFEAERQALALMEHPNIAKVFDAGCTADNRPYIVMELVEGTPITIYCDERTLSVSQRLELFVAVCKAIQHAHQKGIIHRDIKPSNVLVTCVDGRPEVKVIDFGIAKATGPKLTERALRTELGAVVGTLLYMSPEQAELNNLDIDTRSDIYSLGVLLYELLTGTTPLDKKTLPGVAFAAILMQIQEQEPQRPSLRLSESKETLPSISAQRQSEPAKLQRQVRGDLDWIAMKSLAKERERRYETASAFAADVEHFLRIEPIQARPPAMSYRLRKFVRRNKRSLFTTALSLVALWLLAAVVGMQHSLNRTSRDYADLHFESTLLLSFLESHVLQGLGPQNPNLTLREALDRGSERVEVCIPNRPRTEARARQILGLAYRDLGALKQAETQLTKAAQLYRGEMEKDAATGRFDGAGLSTLSSLADLYGKQKRFDDEERLRVEVVDRYRNEEAKRGDQYLRHNRNHAVFALANCYLLQSRWQKAEALFAEVMQECRSEETALNQILGKDRLLAWSLARHAKCLLARNKFAEAEEELRESLRLMDEQPSNSMDRTKANRWLVEAVAGRKKQEQP